MAINDDDAPVTRKEFYRSLVLVWTFIMLAFGTAAFTSRGPISVPGLIYLGAAFLMVANYAAASFRSNLSRKAVVAAAVLAALALVAGAVAFFAGAPSH